jgi:hypothetical protein
MNNRGNSNVDVINQDASLRKLKTIFEDQFLFMTRGNVMNEVRKKVAIVDYEVLRNMASQLSMVSMIINCREDQLTPFFSPCRNVGMPGFIICKKGEYDPKRKSEDKRANTLTEMFQQTGYKYDPEREDDFIDFSKMFQREVLTIDQVAVELQYNRYNEVAAFWLVDGGTIHRCTSKGWENNPKWKFVQEVDGFIKAAYTQEEMIFDYMYKRVDIKFRGYGYSLLEQAVDLVSTLLLGLRYNRDLFTEEKIPKGFLAVQGEADAGTIDSITRYWTMAMEGVGGKFKIPVIPTGKEGTSMDFKMLGQSNRDMEYSKLMFFFLSLFAAVFGMDMAELGIKVDQSTSLMGDNLSGIRQESSKSRALQSLLGFEQSFLNKIMRKIDPEYEFLFVGIDPEDEDKKYGSANKAITSTRTINEMRKEDGLDPLEGEEYNTVLNPQVVQLKGQMQMAEQQEQYEEEEEYEENEEEELDTSNVNTKYTKQEGEIKKSNSLEEHLESLLKSGYKVEIDI